MKTVVNSLRLLVFAGCFVVLLNGPERFSAPVALAGITDQVAPAHYLTCQTFRSQYYSCPSGCTYSSYLSYIAIGSGQQAVDLDPSPCGTAKPGKQCSQPFATKGLVYDPACCVPEYGECHNPSGPDYFCCSPYVCLSQSGACGACLQVGWACGANGDCCTGHCEGACCQVQGPCTTNADCCCSQGVVCVNGQCLDLGGSPA